MKRLLLIFLSMTAWQAFSADLPLLVPRVEGDWWQVAGDPDLGKYTSEKQQPVDFAIWQAADGTWQIWSCIRHTRAPGRTRLLYRWQGEHLTDRDWRPMGIAMEADTGFGETAGGLQAPFVLKVDHRYEMFYGSWEFICRASGVDGKTFARVLQDDGKSGIWTEGPNSNTRDAMVLRSGSRYFAYYTAHPDRKGTNFVRTSKDLKHWSAAKIVAFGGAAGSGPSAAECPFVYRHPSGFYYLFRTQRYGKDAQTSVYRSKNPEDFGVNDDRFRVGTLAVAAPEIVEHEGQLYIAALLPSLKGIQIAKLAFVAQ